MSHPAPELIINSPYEKYTISNFYAWATQTPEFAHSPILSVLRFHSVLVGNDPKEYAVLQCKVSLPTMEESSNHLWILMDLYPVYFFPFGVVGEGRFTLDQILVSTDLHCLLDPGLGYQIIETLHYDHKDIQVSSTATKLSLRHVADMYECAMRCLPQDVMSDFSWLCYAIFECLDRCQACFRSGRCLSFRNPDNRALVDMQSVAYAAVQYIDENHADCCKLSYMPPTPMKGRFMYEFSGTLLSSYIPGPFSPLLTPWMHESDPKKRPHEVREPDEIDDSPPMPPLMLTRPSLLKKPRIDNGEDPVPIPGPHNGTQVSTSERRVAVINSAMSASEIVNALGYYGCANLGHRLDLHSCGEHPMCNGGLGDIYKGEIGGLKVAIKTTRMYIMHDDEKYLKYAAKELYTWSKCKHPNVLSLLGVVEFRGQIGMVSEWMDNGDIRKYLGTRPGVDRCQLCHHISDGLTYLHSVNIIHGDLKGANILISNNGTPMLTDFGNAVLQERSLQFTESTTRTNISPRWSAPEILAGYTSSSYAADVYALGMTWLEVITGKVPFHELRRDQALYHPIVNERKIPQRPNDHIPINSKEGNCFWSLLVNCWAYMPEERPSAAEAQILVRKITQRGLTYIPDPLF